MKRVALFVAAAAICVVGYLFLASALKGGPFGVGVVVPALLLTLATAGLNRLFFRLEGESLAAIGWDAPARRLRQFGFAFVGGCAVVASWGLVLGIVASARWHSYEGFDRHGAVLRLAFCLFNNAAEEFAYRGYLLWKLERRLGSTAAVLSTSALFALLHVQAGVPLASAAAVVFPSAILFSVLVLRWRSLPLVIGFHVATNVAQEILGFRISPLTLWRPGFPEMTTTQRAGVLVLTGLVNLVLAWSLVRAKSRRGPAAG